MKQRNIRSQTMVFNLFHAKNRWILINNMGKVWNWRGGPTTNPVPLPGPCIPGPSIPFPPTACVFATPLCGSSLSRAGLRNCGARQQQEALQTYITISVLIASKPSLAQASKDCHDPPPKKRGFEPTGFWGFGLTGWRTLHYQIYKRQIQQQ